MRHALALLLLVACSASPALSSRDCTPGAALACACPGASGVQTCSAEGTLGVCACADAGAVVDAAVDVVAPDAPPSRADAPPAPDVAPDAPTPAVDAGSPQDAFAAPDAVPADVRAQCESRQTCGAACVEDFQTDPQNCGVCFVSCPARGPGSVPTCRAGRCTIGCQPGLVVCGVDRCVNPLAPTFDCADCGFSCPDGQRCDYNGRRGTCVSR